MPRPYPAEFRRQALALVASGRTVVDVAASLGIAQSCLYRWKQQEVIDRGLKHGQSRTESAQLAAAERRIRDLEEEVKILRKAAAAVEEVVPPKVRFRLVAELHDDAVRITRACQALGVSTSGHYEWRNRTPSKRAILCLAHRPDRADPPGLTRRVRSAPGPRRTGAGPRHHRRAQHRRAADAPHRTRRASNAPPGPSGYPPP